MNGAPRNNFRLTLWLFMSFVIGYMLVFTITHGGPPWKISALAVFLLIGLLVCIMLLRSRKNNS